MHHDLGSTFALRVARTDESPLLRELDDDACRLYEEHGVHLSSLEDGEFARAERARWDDCLHGGRVFFATLDGAPVGFAACGFLDGEPYLDQLSVRREAMRRGVGGALLRRAVEWARERLGVRLWLTTYDHVPFNRPMYERRGFVVVPRHACGPELLGELDEQRRALPFPEHRVAMCRPVGVTGGPSSESP